MGRKIPAKKHRGVKDPHKQHEERFKRLKCKINEPPRDCDEQPAPRSLARLFRLPPAPPPPSRRSATREQTTDKQGITHTAVGKHAPRGAKGEGGGGLGAMRRLPDESGRAFSLRINSALRTLNQRDTEHYPLEVSEEADAKGLHMAERRARRRAKRPAAPASPASLDQPTRGRRLTLRRKLNKEKAALEASVSRREVRYERVEFGEVAHRPPALSALPRRAAPRPAARPLLLHGVLAPRPAPAPAAPAAAERERRERARLDAVNAYRLLKVTNNKRK